MTWFSLQAIITNRQLFSLIVFVHLADGLTTVIGLGRIENETNPLIRAAIDQFGSAGVFVWKIIILILIYLIWKHAPVTDSSFPTHRFILIVAFLGGILPTLGNLIHILTRF